MDQTETRIADITLNEALAKISEMAEQINESAAKLNDSANKLCESATHINQSAARIERANISKGSSFGMLFWLLVLAIVIVVALYFSPHSAIKPFVDRAGDKLGQIRSRVATKVSSAGVQAQDADKASTADPLSANAGSTNSSVPNYPAYPAYPAYPPYSTFMDFGGQSAQNGTPDQATAKPGETEQPVAVKAAVAEAGAKPAASKPAPVKAEVVKPEPAKPVAPQTPPTPPTPTATEAGAPAFPQYPAYPPYPTSVSNKSVPITVEAPKPVENPDSPVMLARKAAREHRYLAAIRAYDAYLDANPNDTDAWGEVGNVRLTAGRPREAAQNFYEAATRLIDQGRMSAVYPLLPTITQNQPRLAAILRQKMAKMGY